MQRNFKQIKTCCYWTNLIEDLIKRLYIGFLQNGFEINSYYSMLHVNYNIPLL